MIKHTRLNIFTHIKKHIEINPWHMGISGSLILLTTTLSIIAPYLYKVLVDDVMKNGKINLLYTVIPLMLVIHLLRIGVSAGQTYVNRRFSNSINLSVKESLMKKILERSLDQISSIDVGRQSGNIEQDSTAVYTFLTSHVVGYMTSSIISAFYLILMFFISPWLALASLVLLPLSIVFSKMIGKKYDTINKELFNVKSKTRSHIFDTIQKWKEIKTNTLEPYFENQYSDKLIPEKQLNSRWMRYFALKDSFYTIKNGFVLKVFIYFIGGILIISGDVSIGSLLMFISYMESMSSALDSIMKSNADFMGQKAVFERLFQILDEDSDIGRKTSVMSPCNLSLSSVNFTYEKANAPILTNVSCSFEHGKKYLIVGESGGGKSTLVKILLGINKVQQGEVCIGETSYSNLSSSDISAKIGVVMQESNFFNLSIRDNLKLIAPNATEYDIHEAISMACLNEFVESLPQKLDTVIGERGVKLSGGKKQRLAIARVLLYSPEIVILDEATSALDPIVEQDVINNLSKRFSKKTMIIISHKAILNYRYDYTYLVSSGRVTLKC